MVYPKKAHFGRPAVIRKKTSAPIADELPYYKRPRCRMCHKRAAQKNLQTDLYTDPCMTCATDDLFRRINFRVYMIGSEIFAEFDGIAPTKIAEVRTVQSVKKGSLQ